jgi:hypothetical protein
VTALIASLQAERNTLAHDEYVPGAAYPLWVRLQLKILDWLCRFKTYDGRIA